VDQRIWKDMGGSDAQSTASSRSTAVRSWVAHCERVGCRPWRLAPPGASPDAFALATEWIVMRWIDFLVNGRRVKVSTASTYLSLVRTWHEYCTGLDLCKGISMVRSRRLVRGLRRKYPSSSARSVRKAMVRSTLVAWRQSRSRALPRDDAYKWLAALLAFKFLLRPGEVCKPQAARWNPQRMLCRGDLRLGVSRSPAGKLVHTLTIFPLKKGPGQAKDLVIPFEDDSGQVMSVVDAYRRVCDLDPRALSDGPMCKLQGKPMGTTDLRNLAKGMAAVSGLAPGEFGGHSYRIGGATALHALKCPELVLKTIGRWSSDIFEIYARAEASQLYSYQAQLTEVDAVPLESSVPGWFR
jgi:hypothetical protein